jgi:RHS repeat-associated protein
VYGLGRIAQVNTTTEYFLGDALGSVRQLVNSGGTVTLAKSYTPYGETRSSAGSGTSPFAFTGEQVDSYIKLIYLRSRMYSPETGRFTSRDSWQGDYNRPLSLNRWNYVEANPVNYSDPNGLSPRPDSQLQSCVTSPKLNGLNSGMKKDVCQMIAELEVEGYLKDITDEAHITQGYRSPQEAHRFSTAYHILHDFVTIEDLRKTPKDMDGTTWYKEEWDALYCAAQNIYVDPQTRMGWLGYLDYLIKKNASDQAPEIHLGGNFRGYIYTSWGRVRDVSYALEGYATGDLHRLPNITYPGVSKHVSGLAVDIGKRNYDVQRFSVWEQQNSEIDRIARKHDLRRPLNNNNYVWYTDDELAEWWHFEQLWIKE